MDARTELVRIPSVGPVFAAVLATAVLAGGAGYAARALADATPVRLHPSRPAAAAQPSATDLRGDRWYLDSVATLSTASGFGGDRWFADPSKPTNAGGDRWYLDPNPGR